MKKRLGDIKMIFEYDENNLDKFENFKGGRKITLKQKCILMV